MKRSFDPEWLNALVNDPAIRPHIGAADDGDLDLSGLIGDARNVCVAGEHGGFFYHWCAPGVYEVHTFVLLGGRGEWARDAAKASLALMVLDHGAELIWTRVRPADAHTLRFAICAGFKQCGADSFDIGDGVETFDLLTWRP